MAWPMITLDEFDQIPIIEYNISSGDLANVYRYLQAVVKHVLAEEVDIGALVQVNTQRWEDWDDLFETDLIFFEPSSEALVRAKTLLTRLRKFKRS